jgi:hypothetical protein
MLARFSWVDADCSLGVQDCIDLFVCDLHGLDFRPQPCRPRSTRSLS